MRKRIGIACIILGAVCLLVAIGFLIYNHIESETAAKASQALLKDLKTAMEENKPAQNESNTTQSDALSIPEEMPTVNVDGYDCIGILSVPVLKLELPVLADWSYAKLKKAPCHYYGSYFKGDFVIAGHSYKAHFGRLSELQPGDSIIFTDAAGGQHCYEVVLLETLPKEATEEMITSGFDLSLYTCTPGGGSRITVRCKAITP